MAFFAAAFGLLLHVLFWGAGLSWLITPRPWRRYWPVFTGLCGIALQSAVVWGGALLDLRGTQTYAYWAELLPVVLLALAGWRFGIRGWRRWRAFLPLMLAVVAVLNGLILPLSSASKTLTTVSLGSCDAADYAAGARVFAEFARSDRDGFIGHTEVVKVHSVDNFFDYWIRLNHFTPSAIVALNGTVAGLEPYQLISITTAVFLVLGMPLVFWLARSAFRYRPEGALLIALIYGSSPLLWYAVSHNAMSQLLAAPAIGLLTWAGVMLWRSGARARRGWPYAGLLVVGYWVVLGSYNFIITICLIPVIVYVVGQAVWRSDFRRLARWTVWMLIPLLLAGGFAYPRVAGLWERFRLFGEYDFGWRIPALSPEGWYGVIRGVNLMGYGSGWRWLLSLALLGGLAVALGVGAKRRDSRVYLAGCLVLPIVAGYVILLLEGRAQGTNSSYDAYKLFASFYPGVLAALAYGLSGLRSRRLWLRVSILAVAVGLLGANLRTAYRFVLRIENAPLVVDRALARLQLIESSTEVGSLNLLINDFWARLWANCFLLHRVHYFPTHTYEARRNTVLNGDWDLLGGLISVKLPDRYEAVPLDRPYSLVDARSPYYTHVVLGSGWHDTERLPRANTRWRWTQGNATLLINNPHRQPLNIGFRFQARSLSPRDLQVWVAGRKRRTVQIGTELSWVRIPSIVLLPGETTVELRSSMPPQPASATDRRLLGFAVYGVEVEVRKEPDPAE